MTETPLQSDAPRGVPAWVRLRRVLFLAAFAAGGLFVLAVVNQWMGLTLAFLFLCWGLLSVAVPMPRLPGLLRLLCRRFPGLSDPVETFLTRMQFDQGGESRP